MADELIDNSRLYKTSSRRLSTPLIVTVVLLLAVLLGGGYVLFQSQHPEGESVESPLPSAAPTSAPTDVPTPTSSSEATPSGKVTPTTASKTTPTTKPSGSAIDRSEVSVSVLNGSGTSGAASEVGDYLTGLGYDVTGTGNADNFDYTDITISVKSGQTAILNQLKKDLSSQGTIGDTSTDYTGSGDAEVIIGQ